MKPAPDHANDTHDAHHIHRTSATINTRLGSIPDPGPSLLGLNASYRLAIAAIAVALLWLCVLWALN